MNQSQPQVCGVDLRYGINLRRSLIDLDFLPRMSAGTDFDSSEPPW
jgi:hypothetical protein